MYQVDPYLILAIAQLESIFGTHIPYNSHNPFGRTCDRREYKCVLATDATEGINIYWNKYDSWDEAIYDEAKYLREHYLDQGLTTICQIAHKYATDPYWCNKITTMMQKFKETN